MRLVKTVDGHDERYDVDRCTTCGERFDPYRARKGFRPCGCVVDGTGHRLLLHGPCGHWNEDPPCSAYGPSASYGDDGPGISTHRPMRNTT